MEDKEYLIRLGEKIRELRKAKMTQGELAEKIGTKHTQIGRIERGEANSTINMLRKIAKALRVTVSELVKI
jgi:transcriptional regulator with XRE-family HTH domain